MSHKIEKDSVSSGKVTKIVNIRSDMLRTSVFRNIKAKFDEEEVRNYKLASLLPSKVVYDDDLFKIEYCPKRVLLRGEPISALTFKITPNRPGLNTFAFTLRYTGNPSKIVFTNLDKLMNFSAGGTQMAVVKTTAEMLIPDDYLTMDCKINGT